jgi:hypothetical protein
MKDRRTCKKKKQKKRNVGKTDGETWLLDEPHMVEPFKET